MLEGLLTGAHCIKKEKKRKEKLHLTELQASSSVSEMGDSAGKNAKRKLKEESLSIRVSQFTECQSTGKVDVRMVAPPCDIEVE